MSQRKRFFIRRFRGMFIVVLMPALILFLLALIMACRNVDGKIRMNSRQSVESVNERLQVVMGNVFQQNSYLTNMARTSAVLKRTLFEDNINYSDAIYLRSLQSLFMSMTNAYEYIDSALIFYDGGDRYIATDSTIHYLDKEEDESWLSLYYGMSDEQDSVITLRRNQGKEVITICKRLIQQDGCIIINLNLEKLQNMFNTYVTTQGQVLYLLDEKGNILVKSTDYEDKNFELSAYINENGGQNGTDSSKKCFWTGISAFSDRLICSLYDTEPELYIVSTTPRMEYFTQIGNELSIFSLIVMLDLIIVILLSYNATRQSFRHISTVLKMFEDAQDGKMVRRDVQAAKDEYDVIMNNIVEMFLNTSYLTTQLKEKQYREENAELMALQLQINPHFLFNTLQTLDLEARSIDKSGDMHRIIRSLSEILKYALEDPHKKVTLEEELGYLKKYMTVQRYRFGDAFIVYYDVDEETKACSVFRMMLQPVLENSLLHGLRRNKDMQGYVHVNIRKEDNWIQIEIADTGAGMEKEELQKLRKQIADSEGKSIGLTNLNRRLLLYYGEKSTLRIESEEGVGTTVRFCIPFQPVAI